MAPKVILGFIFDPSGAKVRFRCDFGGLSPASGETFGAVLGGFGDSGGALGRLLGAVWSPKVPPRTEKVKKWDHKKNGNLSDLDVTELKNNIKYSKIFISIFKLNDWTKTKFTPDYVQKNDDLNYVEKCWIEAANLQKIWYRKNRN